MKIAWTVVLGLALVVVLSKAVSSGGESQPGELQDGEHRVYIPLVFAPPSPAGSYWCNEYEFGLIWTSEVITLYRDGSSIYVYGPPYEGVVTGTWAYTTERREVRFTGFRWPTATYEVEGVLWARRYLADVGFEVAVVCTRREDG